MTKPRLLVHNDRLAVREAIIGAVPPEPSLTLRRALLTATPFPIREELIARCLDESSADAGFARMRSLGLARTERAQRPRDLARVTGEVAESVAQLLLDELGYRLFWQISAPGVHGVDLLLLAPDETALGLEVKGTLRPGTIPRLTPSRLRQMSRSWLADPSNPGMAEWSLTADDLYAGVMVVDLALAQFRIALSGDFDRYAPITGLGQLTTLRWLN